MPADSNETHIVLPNAAATDRLGEIMVELVACGEIVYLCGDLGSGKTSFARRFIQKYARAEITVPSPSFTLVQPYALQRDDGTPISILHADLYRLASAEELVELGLETDDATILLVEWPENGAGLLPPPDVTVRLSQADTPDAREAVCVFHSDKDERKARLESAWARETELVQFLSASDWSTATRREIAGDASTRRYERFFLDGQYAVLMDWQPTPNDTDTYARRVHLATTSAQFCRVADWLQSAGLSAPKILARDTSRGVLLLEDFGTQSLAAMVAEDAPDCAAFYFEAVETLLHLHAQTPPDDLPCYSTDALAFETEQFLDWFVPMRGCVLSDTAYAEWRDLWASLLAKCDDDSALVLRDYHSPNLLWLPQRQARWRVGLIDIQDAVRGAAAYDLVSLLDDARIDVPPAHRDWLYAHYVAQRFGDDIHAQEQFAQACAILTTQRNIRIAGVFARLHRRDGKSGYVRHIPRVAGYVKAGLAHPALADLRDWFARYETGLFDGGA